MVIHTVNLLSKVRKQLHIARSSTLISTLHRSKELHFLKTQASQNQNFSIFPKPQEQG